MGSAYRLSNGDVLGTWGEIATDPQGNPVIHAGPNDTDTTKIIEVNPTDNKVVFESTIFSQTYRTLRAGFYDRYSNENDYLSKRLNNTAVNDLADRSFLAWRDLKRWSDQTPLVLSLKRIFRGILALGK